MRLRYLIFAVLLASCSSSVSAQKTEEKLVVLDNGRAVSAFQAYGQDQPYPFQYEDAIPKAPKGYEAVYMEHYGRHGSRFAYSKKYYETFKKAMDQAESKGMLTEFGKRIKADFDKHYPEYILRTGDLTQVGWDQQRLIGKEMVQNYPSIFSAKDAAVFAGSSDSNRAIMSMAGCCLGIGQAAPDLKIVADQGNVILDATQPKSQADPFKMVWPEREFPFTETEDEFCTRKTNACPRLLSSLFTDPDIALKGIGKNTFIRRLYVLVSGMNSLAPEDRTDFSGLFTPEEFARMWEVDAYQRYHEYYSYLEKTAPVLLSMVKDADLALRDGKRGASLRFGHDHVVMPLLVLLRINGYTREPSTTDEISSIYANIDCPMAGNVQMVFYRSNKEPDILINIRLNGRNATVDGLKPVCDGFYRWEDYRNAVLSALRLPEGKSLEEVMGNVRPLAN